MNCERCKTLISAEADGALSSQESADLRDHLSACATCREFSDEQRHLESWLQAAAEADLEPPDHIWSGIEASIAGRIPSSQPAAAECSDWRMALSVEADAALSGTEAVALQRHLEECQPCSDLKADLLQLDHWLQAETRMEQEPPARIWRNIESRIREKEAEKENSWDWGWLLELFRRPQFGYGLAALALILVAGLAGLQFQGAAERESALAALDAHQIETSGNPWHPVSKGLDNPYYSVDYSKSRNPFGDSR